MPKIFYGITLTLACIALPAFANDLASQKKAIMENSNQQVIVLPSNHFLLIDKHYDPQSNEWTCDAVLERINNGVPILEPLFMEKYNDTTHAIVLVGGVKFIAHAHRFDEATQTLWYTSNNPPYSYNYKLVGDTLKLLSITKPTKEFWQDPKAGFFGYKVETIYQSPKADAQTH